MKKPDAAARAAAMIEELEAAAAGRSNRSDLPEVLAKGALKVITDLKP